MRIHYSEYLLAGLLLSIGGLSAYRFLHETASQDFTRNPSTQSLHLDVGDLNEAKQVRLAVLGAWSRSSDDDVIIEPMADAQGRKFYCIKLAQER